MLQKGGGKRKKKRKEEGKNDVELIEGQEADRVCFYWRKCLELVGHERMQMNKKS